MRPSGIVGGQPQTGINWANVPIGSIIRFYTGKGRVTWTNQAGSSCGGIYNFNTIISMVGDPVRTPRCFKLKHSIRLYRWKNLFRPEIHTMSYAFVYSSNWRRNFSLCNKQLPTLSRWWWWKFMLFYCWQYNMYVIMVLILKQTSNN